MLCVDGDAGAAVEARIRIGLNKFRLMVPMQKGRIIDHEKKVVPQSGAKQYVARKSDLACKEKK